MKKIFLYILIILNFSCTDNDDTIRLTPFVPITITPSLIGKGNLRGSGFENIPQQNTIILNNVEWDQLKAQMDSFNVVSTNFSETNIDFNNYLIIAVFDQIYGNNGHSIDITNIVEYENNIVVTVENLQTGNSQSTITQPYHIVKIPKTTKPIVFE